MVIIDGNYYNNAKGLFIFQMFGKVCAVGMSNRHADVIDRVQKFEVNSYVMW